MSGMPPQSRRAPLSRWAPLSRLAPRLAALAAVLFAVIVPASPASAHAVLQRTTPPAGMVVAAAPVEVLLTFSESVSLVPGKTRVIGPDGAQANRGDPVVRGNVVSIPMRTDAPRGTYLVSYRVISADSHPIGGGYTYSVGEASAPPTNVVEEGTADPVVGALVPIMKYVGYVGLVLVIGPALVLALLWPKRLSRRVPARLAWVGLGLTAFSALAGLFLQAPYTAGTTLTGFSGADLREVIGSTLGTALLIRLGVLAAAGFLLGPLLSGRGGSADRVLLAILAVVGVATWPLAGHPTASPVPAITVLADGAHVAAVAVWLGGLVMLVGFLLRLAQERELAAILPVWSRWAATAVAVLLVAGTLQALVEVGTPKALVNTLYGQLILVKVGLAGVVLAVAAFSRRQVRIHAVTGRPGRLRRLVAAELAVTAVVLGVAAVLVQTPPGRTAEGATQAAASQPYSAQLTDPLFTLQVDIDPAEAGRNNAVHLFAYTKDGKPQAVVEWKGTAALPSAGVEPITIPLLKIVDNHAIGDIALPTAGNWEFRFTLRISEIDQSTVTAPVQVR
jgi:copper transport protein